MFAERQFVRVQGHLARTVGQGMAHAVAGATAGGELFLDDFLAHQPAHDRPGAGLVSRDGGKLGDDDALGVH
ncbi:hypothetical protein D3C80_1732420 [compost metagenome]